MAAAFSSTAAAAPCTASVDRIRADAAALVKLGPRPDSSEAAALAVDHIERALLEFGRGARAGDIGEIEVPRIAVRDWTIREGGLRRAASPNVWVRFEGGTGNRARLLMAHYDSVAGSPGAVDNAGAVAVLLELARCMANEPPPYPVVLVFTGAEEIGLLGARALLRDDTAGPVSLAVSLDLIGHQRSLAINGASALWDRWRLEWLADRVRAAEVDAYVPLVHRLVSRTAPQLERSDHGPFTAAGIPALHLYGRGPEHIYLAYHTPLDTAERLDDAALAAAFDLAAELAYSRERLPAPGDDLGMWIERPGGATVTSATAVIAVEGALAGAVVILLAGAFVRRRRDVRVGAIALIASLVFYALAWGAATGALFVEHIVRGEPLVTFLALPRVLIGCVAIAIAIYCLLLLAATRRWRMAMGSRYHAVAAVLELGAGVALMALGAFELAWLPLVCAALFAIGGFMVHRPIACAVVTGIGAVIAAAPLDPALLRESVFHGFYPTQVPISAVLAAVALPPWLALTGALRASLTPPRDRRVLRAIAVSLALLLAAGVALLLVPPGPCSHEAIELYGYACELAP